MSFQEIMLTLQQRHVQDIDDVKNRYQIDIADLQQQIATLKDEKSVLTQELESHQQKLESTLKASNDKVARIEKHVESLASKCIKLSETIHMQKLNLEKQGIHVDLDLESKQLQFKEAAIQRLINENSKLFLKLGDEREAHSHQLAALKRDHESKEHISPMNHRNIFTKSTPRVSKKIASPSVSKLNAKEVIALQKNSPIKQIDTNQIPNYERKKTPTSRKLSTPETIKKSASKSFKYQEVVRDKETRSKMHGVDCACCSDYYRFTKDLKPVRELGEPEDDIRGRQQSISRHRVWSKRPDTPPGYWDVNFPSTQERENRNAKS